MEKIKSAIKLREYISVKEYMELCLFDEEHGYYINTPPIGKDGDFTTAPEISQMFGEIIALYIINQINSHFTEEKNILLMELGAGRGTLMSDILRIINKFPAIYEKLKVVIIDVNKELIKTQKQTLAEHSSKIEWKSNVGEIDSLPSIIFCNEFFDALPVSQFYFDGNTWQERVVKYSHKNGLYFDTEITAESKNIKSTKTHSKGDILEINEEAVAIMHQLCTQIARNNGIFITFDYGYINNSFNDTLQALKKHKFTDVLQDPGKADITAYVDFSKLVECAEGSGLEQIYFYTQGEFLKLMGIVERAKTLSQKDKKVEVDLNRLIDKNEMGEIFKCLIIEKFN